MKQEISQKSTHTRCARWCNDNNLDNNVDNNLNGQPWWLTLMTNLDLNLDDQSWQSPHNVSFFFKYQKHHWLSHAPTWSEEMPAHLKMLCSQCCFGFILVILIGKNKSNLFPESWHSHQLFKGSLYATPNQNKRLPWPGSWKKVGVCEEVSCEGGLKWIKSDQLVRSGRVTSLMMIWWSSSSWSLLSWKQNRKLQACLSFETLYWHFSQVRHVGQVTGHKQQRYLQFSLQEYSFSQCKFYRQCHGQW